MLKRKLHGVTLVELLVVIAIILIMAMFALPGVNDIYLKLLSKTELERWRANIQLTRQTAISSQSRAQLCPSINGLACNGNWHQGGMVFVDKDLDGQWSANDKLIRRVPAAEESFTVSWRSFQGKAFLQFNANGFTHAQNGTLLICSSNGARYHRAVIVSRSGRARISRDYDGDGVHETSQGNAIDCD
ncbi:GspH/FimT family pseudopilin [Thalassotalea mangrovi]|uniref:Type II secretion system protein H n=1 Tax=Thalassotalea mangrovi TaxID=2572245 RepID=A0A4U1B3C5_9GAMM|nr:GspH/FimT family pseudopilin [Thalassotalea mangrovi]TKB44276.1 prepilin-type N-terminal cleavage/methylation domain-containing protein [Thalassotalea mangrovi]